MTSNMGTKQFENSNFGFDSQKSHFDHKKMENKILGSVRKIFLPELINRIDESIVFNPLTELNVYDIIDLQIIDLINNLNKIGVKLRLYKSTKVYLATKGYNPKYGARFLRRTIQNDLENPISEMLLKYKFSQGSKISVKVVKNKLAFDYQVRKNIKPNISKKVKISVKKDNK